MKQIITVAFLVMLAGGLMYVLADRPTRPAPKAVEMGRLMFFAGLFVFLMRNAADRLLD